MTFEEAKQLGENVDVHRITVGECSIRAGGGADEARERVYFNKVVVEDGGWADSAQTGDNATVIQEAEVEACYEGLSVLECK